MLGRFELSHAFYSCWIGLGIVLLSGQQLRITWNIIFKFRSRSSDAKVSIVSLAAQYRRSCSLVWTLDIKWGLYFQHVVQSHRDILSSLTCVTLNTIFLVMYTRDTFWRFYKLLVFACFGLRQLKWVLDALSWITQVSIIHVSTDRGKLQINECLWQHCWNSIVDMRCTLEVINWVCIGEFIYKLSFHATHSIDCIGGWPKLYITKSRSHFLPNYKYVERVIYNFVISCNIIDSNFAITI